MRSQYEPAWQPGEVLTAEMLRTRILWIAGLVDINKPIGPVLHELECLINQLKMLHP